MQTNAAGECMLHLLRTRMIRTEACNWRIQQFQSQCCTEQEHGNTWICDICDRGAKSTINPLSLKAGVDYGSIGRLPWLSTLTTVEQALLANNRFYSTTFHCSLAKNSGSKMKGHTISLQQDILKQMATTFAGRMQLVVEDVTVIFQHVTRHTSHVASRSSHLARYKSHVASHT
jgi:hypothetical protein